MPSEQTYGYTEIMIILTYVLFFLLLYGAISTYMHKRKVLFVTIILLLLPTSVLVGMFTLYFFKSP